MQRGAHCLRRLLCCVIPFCQRCLISPRCSGEHLSTVNMSDASLPPNSSSPPACPSRSGRVGLTGDAAASSLSDLDWRLLRAAQSLKDQLPERPKQTGFRVFCILTYVPMPESGEANSASSTSTSSLSTSDTALSAIIDRHPYDSHLYVKGTNQQLAFILGTNTEPCFIGSSICSERSALLQLRMKRYQSITKLYIVTDASMIITPGLLCREFMQEFLPPETLIVLAAADQQQPNGFDVQVASLAQLYPCPPIYLNVPGSALQQHAVTFNRSNDKFTRRYAESPQWIELYKKVIETTAKDGRASLHPLRFAAGVLWSDGTMRCEAMTKLLEYGWSLDPMVKLIVWMEDQREKGVTPTLLLLADQYGSLHPPSAPARSHLVEGHHPPLLIFHDRHGQLHECHARELAPDVPDAIADTLPNTRLHSSPSPSPSPSSSPTQHNQ